MQLRNDQSLPCPWVLYNLGVWCFSLYNAMQLPDGKWFMAGHPVSKVLWSVRIANDNGHR